MKYTPKQLETIEQLARICTRPTEIAILLDIPEEKFKSDIAIAGSPARLAYLKGKIATKTEIRKKMVELASVCCSRGNARQGSPRYGRRRIKTMLNVEC